MIQKKFKKLITSAVLVVSVVATTIVVSAETTESPLMESPAITAGQWSTEVYPTTCYSPVETAQGKDAYAEFLSSSFGVLQSNFARSTGSAYTDNCRDVKVKLMEKDNSNGDDYVKMYIGTFRDKKLATIVLSYTKTAGDIEGKGDNAAELYITWYVDKLLGDPTVPNIASGLFKYKVGMK